MESLSTKVAAVESADSTIVAKVGALGYVEITPAQTALFDLLFDTAEAVSTAHDNQTERMNAWLQEQYGSTAPTYAQFKADRTALKALALERGLVDDQWLRKPYNAAVKALYGALPEADSAAAVAKRAEREAKRAKFEEFKAATIRQDDQVSETGNLAQQGAKGREQALEDAIQAVIDEFGMAAALTALSGLLSIRTNDRLASRTLAAIAAQVAS